MVSMGKSYLCVMVLPWSRNKDKNFHIREVYRENKGKNFHIREVYREITNVLR